MQIPWLQRKIDYLGSVYFRGTLAPRAEEFADLPGIETHVRPTTPDAHWTIECRHPAWGSAEVSAPRNAPTPPAELLAFSGELAPEEREQAANAGTSISIKMQGAKSNLLRDRKNLLYFLRALLGDDGLLATDFLSMRFWSRAALDEELTHDADVDITALYNIHAILDDNQTDSCGWLHTHGLAEIHAFDYDILRPARELFGPGQDVLRAIAFAIVEGALTESSTNFPVAHPGGNVRTVSPKMFHAHAKPADAALRSLDEEHSEKRVILCEPATGFLARWSKTIKPSRFLSQSISERIVSPFSEAATELMAARARATYPVFRALMREFVALQPIAVAKLGYVVDGGGPTDREHLWFTVHSTQDEKLDATLENQPFHIERLKQGNRGEHSIELLSDWMLMTPFGPITPRFQLPARTLRTHKDEILREMRRDQN